MDDFRQKFLNAMSRAAATVNVVTTAGDAGRHGVTVSAMSSVSADGEAPVMLVCIHHLSKAAAAIVENGVFAINILRDDQAHIADTFAGRRPPPRADDKFSCAEWTAMKTGAPCLLHPLAVFDCKVQSNARVGTHYVFMGEVQDIGITERGRPLIFANRSYGSAEPIVPFQAEAQRPEGALRIGVLSGVGADIFPPLAKRMNEAARMNDGATAIDLYDGNQQKILQLLHTDDIDVAIVHDIDLTKDLYTQALARLRPEVVLPSAHPLAGKASLRLSELINEPLVLLDAPPYRRYFLSLFEQAGLSPRIDYRPWGDLMARRMVAHGLGYSLVISAAGFSAASAEAAEGISPGVKILPLADELPPIDIVLAWRNSAVPPVAAQFIELCAAAAGAATV